VSSAASSSLEPRAGCADSPAWPTTRKQRERMCESVCTKERWEVRMKCVDTSQAALQPGNEGVPFSGRCARTRAVTLWAIVQALGSGEDSGRSSAEDATLAEKVHSHRYARKRITHRHTHTHTSVHPNSNMDQQSIVNSNWRTYCRIHSHATHSCTLPQLT
jgi:hypothetical protein